MTGILNAVGGIGVLAATWLLALMTLVLTWRVSFELIGCCTFIIVVLVWFIVRDRPEDKGWPCLRLGKEKGKVFGPVEQIPLIQGVRRVISEKYFWPVAIWFFFDCGIFFGFGALWGGPYLMDVYGMTRAQAGTVLSMIAWGMIIGSPPLGFISDKLMSKSRKKPFILCNLVLVIEFAFLSIYPAGLPRIALYIFFLFFQFVLHQWLFSDLPLLKSFFPWKLPELQPVW